MCGVAVFAVFKIITAEAQVGNGHCKTVLSMVIRNLRITP